MFASGRDYMYIQHLRLGSFFFFFSVYRLCSTILATGISVPSTKHFSFFLAPLLFFPLFALLSYILFLSLSVSTIHLRSRQPAQQRCSAAQPPLTGQAGQVLLAQKP
jgi:hypothetical protein